jgi:hypothetical protein
MVDDRLLVDEMMLSSRSQIICERDNNTLQRESKEQLSSKFDHVARDEIDVRDTKGDIIYLDIEISLYGQSLGI